MKINTKSYLDVKVNSSKFRDAAASILIFLYIFDFEIIKGVSLSRSSIVAAVIFIAIVTFKSRKAIGSVKYTLQQKCMRASLVLSVILLIYTFVSCALHSTGDYSLAISIVRSIVWIFITVIAYAAIKQITTRSIFDLLINAMLIQSVIILISMLSPDFKEFTDVFRSESAIERGDKYSGYRALGISGSAFFGLSICYAYLFLILAFYWQEWSVKNPLARAAIVALFVVAGTSAGRTSQVGMVLAILLFIAMFAIKKDQMSKIRHRNIVVICVMLALFVLSIPFWESIEFEGTFSAFLAYASSFVSNLNINDILSSTTSTEALSNMYFPLSNDQLVIGDGFYEVNGEYYLGTDAGYMRPVLYFGVMGLALMCVVQFSIVYVNSNARNKVFFLFTLILLLILQYKGEAILTPVSLSTMLMLSAFEIRSSGMRQNDAKDICEQKNLLANEVMSGRGAR